MEKVISNNHFQKVCKTFLNKIVINDLNKNTHLSKYYSIPISMFLSEKEKILDKLMFIYKRNSSKTKASVISKLEPFQIIINYTFEDSNNKRIKREIQTGDKLVLRLFFKHENFKKKLISRYNIKIDWQIKENIQEIILDEFHFHEALDRTYSIMTMIDELLYKHPVIFTDQSFKEKIDLIESSLYKLYNDIGTKSEKLFHNGENIIQEN